MGGNETFGLELIKSFREANLQNFANCQLFVEHELCPRK